jgi:uncharacterized membrane protein YkoI
MGRSSAIHGGVLKNSPMRRLLPIAAVFVASTVQALAAEGEPRACLGRAEQTAAISHGQAVTLAAAIRSARGSVRGHGTREVVGARLCREERGLVYLLTLLSRDGKVTHATVDATSGKVVGAR